MLFEVLILEDEEYNREFLKKIVNEIPEVTGTYATSSSSEAIELAQKHRPSCILLDIELCPGDISGLAVARSIFSINPDCFMVFITGYTKYALQSFLVHPYDYIIKPINKSKLKALIKEIADKVRQRNTIPTSIIIKGKGECYHISKADILFVEKYGNVAYIHTGDRIHKLYLSLDEIEKNLSSSFFRAHKSYLINLSKVKKVYKDDNRSYMVSFDNYELTASMSRNKYCQYLQIINDQTEGFVCLTQPPTKNEDS
jgi:two-component system LytT family response regulator